MPTPEDTTTPFDGFFALLPDAHFDLLARIVPGMVAVAMYFSSFVASISSAVGIASLVLSGYVVGFLADVLSEFIVRDGWDWLMRYKNKRLTKPPTDDTRYGDYYLWGRIRRLDAANRAVPVKMMAEKAAFRVFACLFLFTFCFPPVPLEPDQPFQVALNWLLSHRIVFLLISGSCCLCYFAIYRWIRFFIDSVSPKEVT